jgi:hypothetical protein
MFYLCVNASEDSLVLTHTWHSFDEQAVHGVRFGCLFAGESFVQQAKGMRVQVVHRQRDEFSIGFAYSTVPQEHGSVRFGSVLAILPHALIA